MECFNCTFKFGANVYNVTKTIKNTVDETIQRLIFQISIKFSERPINENRQPPITSPKMGSKRATLITTIIAIVSKIAISLATINERSSSTLYARLKAFVIALTPFDADQSVPIIPIDNKLPF